MLIYLYLFALVLGGVLLGASMLLGGEHGHDHGHDVDHGHAGEGGADTPGAFSALRSTRFWTFFLAFLGLTGVAFRGLGLVSNEYIGLGIALVIGLLTGGVANSVFRKLSKTEASSHASSSDYVGKSARVLVRVDPWAEQSGSVGKVRVRLKGSTVDLLAVTDEAQPFEPKDEAIIVEMDGTRARIARVTPKS